MSRPPVPWTFRLVLLALLVGGLEVASALGILVLNSRLFQPIQRTSRIYAEQQRQMRELIDTQGTQRHELHPVLGWRYAPNYRSEPITMNAAAMRSRREYARVRPPGVRRVALFGDSFVFGAEVNDAEAWAARLEADGDLEVLNYAVPAYGSDQALLRYDLEGDAYAPELVVLGFPPADVLRSVNVFRRFWDTSDAPLFKPRFVFGADGALTLVPVPVRDRPGFERLIARPQDVREYGAHDHWYEPAIYENPLYDWSATVRLASSTWSRLRLRYGPDHIMRGTAFDERSSAYRLQVAIVRAFDAHVRARGAVPVVVVLPDPPALVARRQGGAPSYDGMVRELRAAGVDVLDASAAFEASSASDDAGLRAEWFAPQGHYNVRGNAALADWVGPQLRARLRAPDVPTVGTADASRGAGEGR